MLQDFIENKSTSIQVMDIKQQAIALVKFDQVLWHRIT